MATVRISREARADFDDIIEHLLIEAGPATAAKYARNLRASIVRLAAFPGIGSPRPELGDQTRIAIVDPYLIFYDGGPDSAVVDVLRILHGRRNVTQRLLALGRIR